MNRPHLLKVTTMSANTRRTARLGCELLEAREVPTVSTITGAFNRTPIAVGDTVWFSSSAHVDHLPTDPSTLHVTGSSVSFTANGQSYTVGVPDTTINFSPTATTASTSFVNGQWVVTAPRQFNGDIFLGGAFLNADATLPGSIKNVQWTNNITADAGAPQVRWHWGAAVYHANFGTLDGVRVKAVDDKRVDAFGTNDPAGTPEDYKLALVRGATGNGGKEYVGRDTRSRLVNPDVTPTSASASISGTLFYDANFNGIIEDGEVYGADAVATFGTVEIDLLDSLGNVVASTTAADTGAYGFGGLAAGTYSIQLVFGEFQSFNLLSPTVGTAGGSANGTWSGFDNIQLTDGAVATGYNLALEPTFS